MRCISLSIVFFSALCLALSCHAQTATSATDGNTAASAYPLLQAARTAAAAVLSASSASSASSQTKGVTNRIAGGTAAAIGR